MIRALNVTKRFGGFTALDDLNINAPKGSVYGLVGPNGAGKSTLIRHLTGAYRQDNGEILIDGLPVYESPAVKEKIGYVPDDIFYFPSANIREMKAFYKGMYRRFDEKRWEKLRDAFNLPDRTAIRRFSKGMQKQATFLTAMSPRPEVMLLDEPVDGLDPVMRRQVWSVLLGDVAEHGMTVFVSSHNLRELEDVCDYVGVINRGKVLIERSLSQLQGGIVKLQAVFDDEPDLGGLDIMHESYVGRVRTAIIRGDAGMVKTRVMEMGPVFCDVLPLTLEEIFIYELGGVDYAVKNVDI